jgi:TrmH family RNA methyltransferase
MGLSQRRRQILGRLRHRKTREREGLVLVEGVRAVREALAGGATPRFAVTSPALESLEDGAAARAALAGSGVEVHPVDDRELSGLSETEHPQGVLLVCVEPAADEGVVHAGGRYLVLDAVQDPGNVGTLVRTATAFALDAVLVLDGTADPWGAKAVRASAGMVFRRPLLQRDAEAALALLHRAGVPLLVADMAGSDIADAVTSDGWALLVANEGAGPRETLRDAADRLVRVPMPGPAESLNAGVAGALLLYALTRETMRAAR